MTIVQVTIVSEIGILGGSPDLVLVTLVAVALTQGSIFGAVTGFWAGLLLDVARLGTLGFTSLLLTLAGFWIGRYGETTGRDRAHAPLLSVAVVTVLYAVGSLVMHFLLREPAPAQVVLIEELPGTIALNLLLTLPVFALVRRLFAAPERPRRRSSSLASRPTPIRPGRFLPRDPRVDAPYRLTPQLVFRIGILGFLTLAVFAILFFRLWALQVLSGNQYLVAAQNNQLRVMRTDAPRGPIEDRYGRVLVENTSATAVKIWPADLPKHGAYAELRRLARILQVPLADITSEIKKNRGDPVTPVTVRDAVSRNEVYYLYEHQSEFPGMAITNTFVRNYPFGDLAAHILGYVGEISQDQLKSSKGYVLGDKVGQAGIESSFDKELRGRPGLSQLRVDSLGRPISPIELRTPTTPGYAVRLTLDAKLQRAAQQAIVSGINLAQADHQWYAKAGAIVALDPRDGAIRALASYPTFDPSAFTSRKKGALELADQLERGQGGRLSGARPRDRRRVSAGLDVQAGDGAGRDAGAHPLAVQRAAMHGLVQGRGPGLQELGPVRERSR